MNYWGGGFLQVLLKKYILHVINLDKCLQDIVTH